MTSIALNKVIHATVPTPDIRFTLTKHRTATIDDIIFDKVTSEVLGSYTHSEYTPEPFDYPVPSGQEVSAFIIDEDGSPISIVIPTTHDGHTATVNTLPTTRNGRHAEPTTGKGRKASVVKNPLYAVICAAKVEEIPTPWLDDYVRGAINMGPGVINGRYSVSTTDVTKLLYQPEISVESASRRLLNHDHEPMSVRQIQRVVEAARVSLRGIALHLERHPEILLGLGLEIDFNPFWASGMTEPKQQGRKEHPKRQEVLRLLEQGEDIKSIARQTDVSRNTIKKWKLERLTA
ncbi:helix-turn-helix domain-containing protein [Pseudomonas sp. FP2294]|uniref:helix-turn-helix transcriptional regulator n=1 Tax=Pseudomonas sp. FP2294 TaxID=2954089 RepID=UPI0027353829|nr:helix-turn-helix domain-containing protein [Pseudomonas sp. FP2294]WLH55659.1 helix-turn-helix domain-containing protein [Pseudomonas sp. FP2294]